MDLQESLDIMTNEEALKAMKILFITAKWDNRYNSREVSKIVFEALGKQIPKKMNTVEGYHYCCFTCPTCNEYVRIYQDNGYCLNCGQKILWE